MIKHNNRQESGWLKSTLLDNISLHGSYFSSYSLDSQLLSSIFAKSSETRKRLVFKLSFTQQLMKCIHGKMEIPLKIKCRTVITCITFPSDWISYTCLTSITRDEPRAGLLLSFLWYQLLGSLFLPSKIFPKTWKWLLDQFRDICT